MAQQLLGRSIQCAAVHIDSGYGYRPNVTVPCFRMVHEAYEWRHRGQHQGWQQMPAGVRTEYGTGRVVEAWGTWSRLWTWERGGAQGSAQFHGIREPCPVCGVLVPPATDGGMRYPGAADAYAVPNLNLGGACFDCRLWAERIDQHAAGWLPTRHRHLSKRRSVRSRDADGKPSERLSGWVDGLTGAFGDRKCSVTWDDGDTRGPASSLWDGGAIPWWLDDQLPANATVKWGA